MLFLIVLGSLLRIAFGSLLGLGVDESYVLVAGRSLHLGYYDHPPAVWWLSWAASHLGAGEAAVVVRLPFVGLFAGSTWLMFRFATRLYDSDTGLWAALLLNLSPVFSATFGSWVLPDGPLDCALLGAALCLTYALDAEGRAAWLWWVAAGLCAALALLSKYVGCLAIAGAAIYLISAPSHRYWLRRPHPYVAGLVVILAIAWIVDWNAAHGWASVVFQGSRAGGHAFRPQMLLTTLAGEALFMLPWLWLPLTALFATGLMRGPSRPQSWLPVCLSAGPIVLFPLISLWASQRVLFHWAAPGYLMLFPALGHWFSRAAPPRRRWIKPALIANAVALIVLTGILETESRWEWVPNFVERLAGPADPDRELVNWTSLGENPMVRRLLSIPGVYAAGASWQDCGKIGYALGPKVPLVCLADDSREFGIASPVESALDHAILVVLPTGRVAADIGRLAGRFRSLKVLGEVSLRSRDELVMSVSLFIGSQLRSAKCPSRPAYCRS